MNELVSNLRLSLLTTSEAAGAIELLPECDLVGFGRSKHTILRLSALL